MDERATCNFLVTARPDGVDSRGVPRPLLWETLANRIWSLPFDVESELRRRGDPQPAAEIQISPGALDPTWTLTVRSMIAQEEVDEALVAAGDLQWLTLLRTDGSAPPES